MRTFNWIRKSDKYHKWYECEACGCRIVASSRKADMGIKLPPLPPLHCPYCYATMNVFAKEESDG